MTESHLIDYIYIFVFLIVGVGTALGPFILSSLVHPRSVLKTTLDPYECGMDVFCPAWEIRFHITYYIYALIFLAFAVDILFLFPVAAAFHLVSGMRGVIELFIFIFILALAVVYPWAKGVFTWPKRKKIY
jgi:NADH:ubiquinone oxidoreductase subunit 3 (subunit A)